MPAHPPLPIIETPRLILRPFELTDVEGLFQLDRDPEVQKYLMHQSLSTREEALQRIKFIQAQYQSNGIGRVAIIEKVSGNFIGWAGLKFIDETINHHINFYDIGYRLLKPEWGKGFATEATKACIVFAFDDLKLTQLYAFAHLENKASRNVLEKCGLTYVESFDYKGVSHSWFKINSEKKLP